MVLIRPYFPLLPTKTMEKKYYLEEGFLKVVESYLDCYLEEEIENPFTKKQFQLIFNEFLIWLEKEVRQKEKLPF